jgi:MoaA/NifB/PqqE/SkfB family radical SAM enzyme
VFSITCSYERLGNGSYSLVANPNWRLKSRKPLILEGALADLWEQLVELCNKPTAEQRVILGEMDRSTRAGLLAAIAPLRKGCLIALDSGHAVDTLPDDGRAQLIKLQLELTYRCNFRCSACYLGSRLSSSSDHGAEEASTSAWIGLIREAGKLGCCFATVTGGEPFLRRDLHAIIDELSENGIFCEINTNGSCISAKVANTLRHNLISIVEVSVYGYDQQSASEYTGRSKGHQASLNGIRNLVEAGIPVAVKYFATRNNYRGFDRLVDELEPLGLRPSLIGHAIHADIFDGTLPHDGIQHESLPVPEIVQEDAVPCFPGGTGLNIEPDGSTRACTKIVTRFGNVFAEGLEQIWSHSSRLQDFRRFWFDYCQQKGFVKGAKRGALCPASDMLSSAGGYEEFNQRWRAWRSTS